MVVCPIGKRKPGEVIFLLPNLMGDNHASVPPIPSPSVIDHMPLVVLALLLALQWLSIVCYR